MTLPKNDLEIKVLGIVGYKTALKGVVMVKEKQDPNSQYTAEYFYVKKSYF
jgi:hypothetical protein